LLYLSHPAWFDGKRKNNMGDFNMRHTTPITIEHIVVASNQPYEKVSDVLEARLGSAENWEAIGEHLLAANASEEQVPIRQVGKSGMNGWA
jgi:hypothetical protein